MSKTLYILLQCELLKTLHWNLSKKHLFKLWGEEKKNIHRLHYQRYAIFVHHFVSSTHHFVNHQSSDPESTCLRHIQHLMGTG